MLFKLYIILFMTLLSCIVVLLYEKPQNYGHFNAKLTKVDTCKGPKKRDCGTYTLKVVGKTRINNEFHFTEDVSPTKGKVVTTSKDNEILRLQMNKPCENLFLKPLFSVMFNITKNCIIKKGRYNFTLDVEDTLQKYYGGMHLYGLWTFKSHFSSDQCNLICTVIEVNFNGQK